ncbi:O-methyltransferase [Pedobacter endophyticus]|uniref:Class I SAM-dependent methyltransferase n=1 Tax=Pedobacter endophyticus TaxID=2789740 RepID=A0A7S9L2X8_9SPHI|nr:class I SAM-dependent methyltransferase [Pedobacter endophyticus]QPH41186.1 class I SAM-dependent methyltransferase [Pedobacter endophyticus]
MNELNIRLPERYQEIKVESTSLGFDMLSDVQTGSLLRTLVSSKPNGFFLELGTGTGLSLSWLVDGMDKSSKLISIDNSADFQSVAARHFGKDDRVKLICEDANQWIKENQDQYFDLIFADAWPGKYESLQETLNLMKTGGFYIIDDMLPQPNWPMAHEQNVEKLIAHLETLDFINLTKMNWSTGLVIITKIK